jgi:hypothetical protein
MNKPTLGLLAAALSLGLLSNAAAIEVQLFNFDTGTGLGLDDPTPRAPVGGNPGQTLGQQRQIAYQYAADLWSAVLDGDVPVRVIASTQPLPCTPTSGTLAQAGTRFTIANFPGGLANTRYHIAIAKGILNQDFATDYDILTHASMVRSASIRIASPAPTGTTGWMEQLRPAASTSSTS